MGAETVVEKVRAIAERVAAGYGLEIFDVQFRREAPGMVLRVAFSSFDLTAVEYYRAFQHWKVAILAEGVKRRYESATMATSDVDFDHLARRVVDLADLADHHLALAPSRS